MILDFDAALTLMLINKWFDYYNTHTHTLIVWHDLYVYMCESRFCYTNGITAMCVCVHIVKYSKNKNKISY